MVSLLVFLGILSVLILVHEFGHFIVAKKLGVDVERFSLGFGPRLLKKKMGGTEYTLSVIPLGGYVKFAGDTVEEYKGKPGEYFAQPPGRRFLIIFCGPLLNYILGLLLFWFIFWTGFPDLTTKVGGLIDGFGAQRAGILQGDIITAIDGAPVRTWTQLQTVIQRKRAESGVTLNFLRHGRAMTLPVVLRQEERTPGVTGKSGILGIRPSYEEIIAEKHPAGESLVLGIRETFNLTVMTYRSFWGMIRRRVSMKESVMGPLGIFMIASEAARIGFIPVIHLMAILSVSLALFNLLPLPILDGGHILFLGIEKARGRMLSVRIEGIITRIGMTFIIGLAFLVTYNDIMRMFGDKLAKFIGN